MVTEILVVGLGYVGLPLASQIANAGYQVFGYDKDPKVVGRVASRLAGEEGLEEGRKFPASLASNFSVGSTLPSDRRFGIVIVCVPTPLVRGDPDLSFVRSAMEEVGGILERGDLVCLESTTFPGTTEKIVAPILNSKSGLYAGSDFHLGYAPERVDPGNNSWRLGNTPRLVAGLTPTCRKKAIDFYESIGLEVVPVENLAIAEAAKIFENTFRLVNISLSNEFALKAQDLGIDFGKVLKAASTKPFGFLGFEPGVGAGGHCVPVDPVYFSWLAEESGFGSPKIVEVSKQINNDMPAEIARRIYSHASAHLGLRNPALLLCGLSYKRDSGDMRNSQSVPLVEELLRLGATVVGWDPLVSEEDWPTQIQRVSKPLGSQYNLGVVVQHHAEQSYSFLTESGVPIIDLTGKVGNATQFWELKLR